MQPSALLRLFHSRFASFQGWDIPLPLPLLPVPLWCKGLLRDSRVTEGKVDEKLPETYDRAVFTEKCNNVFETMLNYASQGVKWVAAARFQVLDKS